MMGEQDRLDFEALLAAAPADEVGETFMQLARAATDDFPELATAGSDMHREFAAAALSQLRAAVRSGLYEEYQSYIATRTRDLVKRGFTSRTMCGAVTLLRAALYQQVDPGGIEPPGRLQTMIAVSERCLALDQATILDECLRATNKKLSETVKHFGQLTTPVIQVWDGILAAPLVGAIDSERARRFTEDVLSEIVRTQASAILIDITGVPVIDTAVANHLVKTIKSMRLLGTSAYLVGLSPNIANTLVQLGVTFEGVVTAPTFQVGLQSAISKQEG